MKRPFVIGLYACSLIFITCLGRAQNGPTDYHDIVGSWVRPDAPYTLIIEHVDQEGQMVASLLNKDFINLAKAQARLVSDEIFMELELRQMRYSGSHYKLRYDNPTDRLVGTYYHSLFKQEYNIFFVRK